MEERYNRIINLSRDLMAEDYAIFIQQTQKPHFGQLVDELFLQNQLDVMRLLLQRREIQPNRYASLAGRLAQHVDPLALDILITNSSLGFASKPTKEEFKEGKDIADLMMIPEISTEFLGPYLNSDMYKTRVEAHLIRVLKECPRPGMRAMAARALSSSRSTRAVKALQGAVNDKGHVRTDNGPFEYVYEYAQDSLEKSGQATNAIRR